MPFGRAARVTDGSILSLMWPSLMSSRLSPRIGSPAADSPARKAKGGWSGRERRRAIPTTVLVVDDQPDQRDLYRQYLAFEGYRVDVAASGREALERVTTTPPDVVVMDLAMPVMDGFEATRRIKELPRSPQVPVIALTAFGEMPPEWAEAAGCDAYLRKPCLPSDLGHEIRRVLRGRRR